MASGCTSAAAAGEVVAAGGSAAVAEEEVAGGIVAAGEGVEGQHRVSAFYICQSVGKLFNLSFLLLYCFRLAELN